MSFRLKTIIGIVLIQGILLCVLILNDLHYLRKSNETELTKRALTTAVLFASVTKNAVLSTDLASLETLVQEVLKNPDLVYARVLQEDGQVLIEMGKPTLLGRKFQRDYDLNNLIDGIFDTSAEIAIDGIVFGRVEIGVSLESMQQILEKAKENAIGIAVLEILLTAVFSFFLGMYLTRQLDDLKEASEQIAAGELGYQVQVKGRDELAQTAQAFNLMSAKLKNAYDDLSEKEEKVRTLMDTVIDGIVTFNEHGIIQTVNSSMESIFLYSSAEMIGQNIQLFLTQFDGKNSEKILKLFLEKNRSHIGLEGIGQRKNDERFPIDLATSEMVIKDERIFVGLIRDITERKEIENIKDEFVSIVSHELRTPLTAIRGSLGLILGGVSGKLPDKAKSLLEIATKNTERLSVLINDILDMEKIISGKMEFVITTKNIHQIMESALAENQGYAEKYNVRFVYDNPMPNTLVEVDENRILQVMANLLSNAAKFSPAGSEIKLSLKQEEGRVVVEITDQGSGIPEAFHAKIFQKFAQADSSDTRQKEGSGLGLSISKAIVEYHGGTIGFRSNIDQGTTFFFDIPTLQVESFSQKVALPKHCNILICLEPNIATFFAQTMDKIGCKYEVCYDRAQLEKKLEENKATALIVDPYFFAKNKIPFFGTPKENKVGKLFPIILVSSREGAKKKALEQGMFPVAHWIKNPFDVEEINQAIREITQRTSMRRPLILHVEDDISILSIVAEIVENFADFKGVMTMKEAKKALSEEYVALVILDMMLPDGNGSELIDILHRHQPPIPVIIFSALEVGKEMSKKVSATIVKSRTPNEKIVEIIQSHLPDKRGKT